MSATLVLCAIVLLVVAAITDVAYGLIPNWISLALLVCLVPYAWATPGFDLAGAFLLAAGVAVVTIGAFAMNWLGGGDAKLLPAAAAWVWPWQSGVQALFWMAIAGGVISLVLLIGRGRVVHARDALGRALGPAGRAVIRRRPDELTGVGERKVPYGVAIAFGAIWVLGGRVTV